MNDEMRVLQAKVLACVPGLAHGFTTRDGGISQGPWRGLNLGHRVGDDRAAVKENISRVLAALGRSEQRWVCLKQVHGNTVVEVRRHAGRSIEADAVWTQDPEVVLAIMVADCVPILLAHRSGGAVAAVHAGWRGTAANVVGETVKRLNKAGFAPGDLVAAIGPAIAPCCFEVGEEVVQQLLDVFPHGGFAIDRGGAKPKVDLAILNRMALEEAGVPSGSIEQVSGCTACEPRFYSYRRDAGDTGRQAGVIGPSRR